MATSTKELHSDFKYAVAREEGGERVQSCFQCGLCTASCPVRDVNPAFNPRRIIHLVLMGMRDQVIKSDTVWLCSTCYACQERCPQDVRITELMNALKNLAVKAGFPHPAQKKQAELVYNSGRLYEIEEFDNRKRQRLGLPPLRPKVEEVKVLYRVGGIEPLIRGPETK
jgi:heterodisulfide reductase subunit C